jgi:hypothetical protein
VVGVAETAETQEEERRLMARQHGRKHVKDFEFVSPGGPIVKVPVYMLDSKLNKYADENATTVKFHIDMREYDINLTNVDINALKNEAFKLLKERMSCEWKAYIGLALASDHRDAPEGYPSGSEGRAFDRAAYDKQQKRRVREAAAENHFTWLVRVNDDEMLTLRLCVHYFEIGQYASGHTVIRRRNAESYGESKPFTKESVKSGAMRSSSQMMPAIHPGFRSREKFDEAYLAIFEDTPENRDTVRSLINLFRAQRAVLHAIISRAGEPDGLSLLQDKLEDVAHSVEVILNKLEVDKKFVKKGKR